MLYGLIDTVHLWQTRERVEPNHARVRGPAEDVWVAGAHCLPVLGCPCQRGPAGHSKLKPLGKEQHAVSQTDTQETGHTIRIIFTHRVHAGAG